VKSAIHTRILLGAADATRERLCALLERPGIQLVRSVTTAALWSRIAREDFDVVILDGTALSAQSGDFAALLRTLPEHPALIVLTEEEHPEERARLLSAGCSAVLWLGLEDELLSKALVAVAERHSGEVLERLGATRSEKRSTLDDFVSLSPNMQEFLVMARRVVKGDSALLILGETGVGKERLARSIHSESARGRGPFITVNCGALPESLLESELFGHEEGAFTGATRSRRGYFELAHGGTIFLDEIGEMPLHLQVKLLRVLEDKSIRRVGSETPVDVDVRVMAATNRDLKHDMEKKEFRPDLYYRLAVVTLTVPPLRERREDIRLLAETFLNHFARRIGRDIEGYDRTAMEALVAYDWPGNVRELINVVERAVLLARGDIIHVTDLRSSDGFRARKDGIDPSGSADATDESAARFEAPLQVAREELLKDFERRYLEHHLAQTRGRVGVTAKRAGVNERTLYALMKRHGLRKKDYRGTE
jgi:DNA-binding NtrC family response regulator